MSEDLKLPAIQEYPFTYEILDGVLGHAVLADGVEDGVPVVLPEAFITEDEIIVELIYENEVVASAKLYSYYNTDFNANVYEDSKDGTATFIRLMTSYYWRSGDVPGTLYVWDGSPFFDALPAEGTSGNLAEGFLIRLREALPDGNEPNPEARRHAVVRTDKMFGTKNKAGLASFKFVTESGDDLIPEAIENGNVVKVDGLMEASREIYKAVAPTADTELKNVLLVADPEVLNHKKYHSLAEFINEAGEAVRGYFLHTNDIFSVTTEAIDGEPEVDSIIELMNGTKLKAVESATSGSTQVGKIIAKEIVGSIQYYVIQVTSTEMN